ncbi:murinoglobulin-1-like [Bactrocera tryoni]|uniref:murinoglobulin-1-like n=1 Tax=Bactrocera tryoni TaxID=59916 RepID=UPI001A96E983|nr:murinoglobulin-1-like [Bactrocera tryoni]
MYKLSELLPILGLAITVIVEIQADGYYTITSPGSIRPNTKYSIYVSVYEVQDNARIGLTLKGPDYSKNTEIVVPPNSGESATFEFGDIKNGIYTLIAQGLSGIIFENSTNLEYIENPPMVYLQTDKAMYKFGDTIQFRAIFLDQYLLPAKVNQQISIVLKDSQNNTVERFDDVVLNTGVYKGKLKLAEQVIAGEWSIQAFVGQQMLAEKIIEVKDYEPPSFEVALDIPSHVTLNENEFVVGVRARYDANSPVSGSCVLNIIPEKKRAIRMIHQLENGNKEIPIYMYEIGRNIQNVIVNVTVEDTVHNIRTISKVVRIVPHLHVISMPSMSYECHEPNEVFLYRALIYNYNGDPIDVDDNVLVTLNPGTNGGAETFVSHVNDEGYIDVKIECSNYRTIIVTINYEDSQKSGKIELKQRNDNSKEGIHVNTQFPTIDGPMEVHLASREPFSSFICVIVGRGNIVYSNIIEVPNGGWSQTHTFFITPTYEMMPEAHMFVNFIKSGKMVSYETTFSVKSEFKNTLTFDTPEIIKPGTILSLSIFTEPNSYVGLLGMDKDALMLQTENNLNTRKIFNDLSNVQSKTPKAYLHINSPYPGETAGLVTLTNANYYLVHEPVAKEKNLISKHFTPRNYFETFAFVDYVSVTGYDEVPTKLPTTSFKSWVITGFALSPKTGFTLTTSLAMKTVKNIYVDIDLPNFVKKGRTVILEAEVYNYLQKRMRCAVSLENKKNEFEFVTEKKFARGIAYSDDIQPGKSKKIDFQIRPRVRGMITLKVYASCPLASYVNIKKLRVL